MAFIYSDLNQFNPTKKPVLEDIEAVYQSLFNILNTRKGERLFLPEFGIDLDEQLFTLIDDVSSVELQRLIIDGIETFEPRVIIDTGQTLVTPDQDNNRFEIDLVFQIQGITDQTFSFQGAFTA